VVETTADVFMSILIINPVKRNRNGYSLRPAVKTAGYILLYVVFQYSPWF